MDDELTICSVSFDSAAFIDLNVALTAAMNESAKHTWIIAENSPPDSKLRLVESRERVKVIPGVAPRHAPTYHHTLALSECVRRATSRYVATLDPDFFVVRYNWIKDILAHMKEHRLAILGVPWHPKSNAKYRYFPAVHFSIFDTKRFPLEAIDFRPDFPDGESDPNWPEGWVKENEYFAVSPYARILARIPFLRQRRRYYTDTGSRLYKRYVRDSRVSREIFTPVFDLTEARSRLSPVGTFLERVLPDELCYFPKGYNSINAASFLESTVPENVPPYWEEFTWKDAPLGFHVRRNLVRSARSSDEEFHLAKRIIDRLENATR